MIGESGFQISSEVFRMREEAMIEKIRAGNPAGLEAVSYTHLDVYKRQPQHPDFSSFAP